MRKVLVTGGAGFIGHRLVERLSQTDSAVTVVDNLSNANPGFLQVVKRSLQASTPGRGYSLRLDGSDRASVSMYVKDIRNKESILEVLKAEAVDTCIHLAAKTDVPDSIRNPEETIDINIKGTFNVLEACSKAHVKNFVFASSSAVYGEAQVLPITEEQQLNPMSPYGASKIAGEALVASFGNSEKIENGLSLRFFNVYGKGQNNQYAGVITRFAERLSASLPPIIYGDGNQIRDFIFVEDIIDSILLSVESKNIDRASSGKQRVFNIGTGKATNIRDLAQIMTKIFAVDVSPIFEEYRKGDIINSMADITKLNTILGYSPSREMWQSLRSMFVPV